MLFSFSFFLPFEQFSAPIFRSSFSGWFSYLSLYLSYIWVLGFLSHLSTGQRRVKLVPICYDLCIFYCCSHSLYFSFPLIWELCPLPEVLVFWVSKKLKIQIFSRLTEGVLCSVLEDGLLSSWSYEVREVIFLSLFSFGFLAYQNC